MQQQMHVCFDDIQNINEVKFVIKPKKKPIRFADAPIGFFISEKGDLCYKRMGLVAFVCSTGDQFFGDRTSLEQLADTLVYPCKCKIKVISDEGGE